MLVKLRGNEYSSYTKITNRGLGTQPCSEGSSPSICRGLPAHPHGTDHPPGQSTERPSLHTGAGHRTPGLQGRSLDGQWPRKLLQGGCVPPPARALAGPSPGQASVHTAPRGTRTSRMRGPVQLEA